MAITFDVSSQSDTSSGTSLTFSHTTTTNSGRAIVVSGDQFKSGLPTALTCTYAGASLTQIGTSAYGAGGDQQGTLLGKAAPATGANDVVLTTTESGSELVGAATTWYGVDQTTPFDTGSTTTISAATSVSQDISSAANDLVIDHVAWYNGVWTIGSGQTQRVYNDNTTALDSIVQSSEPGAGTVTMSHSWSASEYAVHIAVNMNVGSTDATATPNDLASTGTFPAVTTANQVNATKTVTALAATSTFGTPTVRLDQTRQPASLAGLVTFPTVTAYGSTPATATLTAIPGAATFPTVTPVAINGVVAPLTLFAVTAGFPTPDVTYTFSATPALTALAVTVTVDAPTVFGGTSGVATVTVLAATATFPPVTVGNQVNRTTVLTAVALTVVFPSTMAQAFDLSYRYNDAVTLAVEIAFSDYPLVASPTWYDISGQVTGFTVTRGRQSELDEYAAGVATVSVYANSGDFDPTNTGSPYYPNVLPMKQIRLRANYGGVTYTLFRGFVEAWPTDTTVPVDTVTIRAVDGFKVLNLVKDSTAQSEENSGVRVGHLLDEAGWPSALRNIGTGAATVAAITPACSSALQLIRTITVSEAGQFYIDQRGYATFRPRYYRSGLSSAATFDNEAGYVPYHDIGLQYDDAQIWNRIQLFVGGFPSYSSSTASQDAYGIRQLTINDVLLPNTTDGDDLADIYVARYDTPTERATHIDLDPEYSPALMWPQVLGRDLSDKITVRFLTRTGNLKVFPSFIESVSHRVTISPRRWRTRFTLSQKE